VPPPPPLLDVVPVELLDEALELVAGAPELELEDADPPAPLGGELEQASGRPSAADEATASQDRRIGPF
jgi:hypothetical protein